MTTEGRPYLLSARAKVHPGKAAEFAQRWQAYYGSKAPELAGFREAYYSVDEATNTTLALWVWTSKPDEAQWRQAVQGLQCTSQRPCRGCPDHRVV